MARVKRGVTKHARHKKVIDRAKGARGRQKNTFRAAKQRVDKNMQYAYRDRRTRKRAFRGLWIQRINAAVREHGLIEIDRKVLSDIAVREPGAFKALVDQAQASLT